MASQNKLELYFSSDFSGISLQETYFYCEGEEPIRLTRGKGEINGFGTFKWTPGVQSACLLFLHHLLSDQAGFLEGEAGSPAATLDYAIAKQTGWLLNMFGMDYEGRPVIRAAVHRQNAERKRPGPVRVSINSAFLPKHSVRILLNGRSLVEARELSEVDASITSQFHQDRGLLPRQYESVGTSANRHSSANRFKEADSCAPTVLLGRDDLHPKIIERALQHLADANADDEGYNSSRSFLKLKNFLSEKFAEELRFVFRRSANHALNNKHQLKSMFEHRTISRLVGKNRAALEGCHFELSGKSKLGLFLKTKEAESLLRSDTPIRAIFPAPMVGVHCILNFLKVVKGYNFEISYGYPNTMEMLSDHSSGTLEERCDILFLSVASAGRLLGRTSTQHFQPVMITPTTTHRIVTPISKVKNRKFDLNHGSYTFMTHGTSTTASYFDELAQRSMICPSSVTVEHSETFEMPAKLGQPDPDVKSILFFPFDWINCAYNNCQMWPSGELPLELMCKDTVLFAHERVTRNKPLVQALNVAFRDAYFTLLEDPAMYNLCIELMMEDPGYIKLIARCAGTYAFESLMSAPDARP